MKIKEIREMEIGHLLHELTAKQKHLFALRTQAVTEKLENPSQLGKTRKEIAQIKTILRQREIKGEIASAGTAAASAAATAAETTAVSAAASSAETVKEQA
jgi:large subunit ribosomal protein L29